MGKYEPLDQVFANRSDKRVRMSFSEIEGLIDSDLPPSAHKYSGWWTGTGSQTVWRRHGWRAIPNLRNRKVDFRRDGIARRQAAKAAWETPVRRPMPRTRRLNRRERRKTQATGRWAGVEFVRVCTIRPERDPQGRLIEHHPRTRYDNRKGLRMHSYGEGPFCRFKIPGGIAVGGVYVIAVDGACRYVGETENLTSRYNNGYGSISPRACFEGGQSTNCRINGLILQEASRGSSIELWFVQSANHKKLESGLIRQLRPDWNIQQ